MTTEVPVHALPTFRRRTRLLVALLLALAIAVPLSGAATTQASAATATAKPCDIYATGGTPCEAAYSTTRALFASYNGPLYQIQRASDSSTLNIGLQSAGGVVNSAPQVSFCSGTTCTITQLYDQSANGNNLPVSPGKSCSGCSGGLNGPGPNGSDIGANAMALPVTIGGQRAYGVLVNNIGTGYRNDAVKNVPTGSQPEGEYMMTSSMLTSGSCCFDFGSAETNDSDDGNATMNAIYYGTACWTGGCTGSGPWVGGDLENGMYFSAAGPNPSNITSESGSFVSAWEKNNGTTNFTLKYGNGQSGGLTTSYSGALPNGYDPMKVQPSVELGTGGDNSPMGKGEFFEGAVTAGFPSDATENAVQANLVAAGYSGNTDTFSTSTSVVSLRAHANGKYVDAANSTTSLIADAGSIGTAETFDMFTNTDGTVNLRAHSDNDWVTAENDGASPLIANRGAAGPWETFYLIHNADGSVSFRAYNNGDIVTADDAGASPLIANRTAIGQWEEFDLLAN
jgi:non-reducing end alpha-L-arabinofuranosidase